MSVIEERFGNGQVLEQVSETPLQPEQAGQGTDSGMEGLTVLQVKVFEVLSHGGTIVAAAKAAGVSRQTVQRWLRYGNAFATAYSLWKQNMAENARARLLILSDAATVQIAKAISQGDTQAAMDVVKGMGLLAPPPVGPSMTEATAEKEVRQAAKARREDEFSKYAFTVKDLLDQKEIQEEMRRQREAEGERPGSGIGGGGPTA